MNEAAYLADMLALKTLITNLTHHLNRSNYSSIADFFCGQAIYEEDGQDALGLEGIAFLLEKTSANLGVRQLSSDPYLEILDDGKARGSFLRIMLGRPPGTPCIGSVSDVVDEYKLCLDRRWRISKRTVSRIE